MKKYSILFIPSISSEWVSSCPAITCSDENVATDDDDWCVKIDLDENAPQQTTITIRECIGESKPFCDWFLPGKASKGVWPYSIDYLKDV